MKKNPIPVILPVLAIIIALIYCSGLGNSTEKLQFSIENRSGSYYVVGEYENLESIRLSDGKKVKIDNSTGEIITCSVDDGINSFELIWGSGDNRKDTIIAQSADGKSIKLDHKAIQSNASADCPPLPLSEVEFVVTGPNKDCKYTLEIKEAVLEKGYADSDILVSLTGQNGPYSKIRSWERKESGNMDVWVKSNKTGQELGITTGLKYQDCQVFACDQATQTKLNREIKKALSDYILDYKNRSLFMKASAGKRLVFIKNGKTVQTSSFMAEVGVNGGNMRFGGAENTLEIVSVTTSDCLTFNVKYKQK